jgi:hypothetical protein
VELQLLVRAIEAMSEDDRPHCREYAELFVAVRHTRWTEGDPFVAAYEQGKELLEGTAKYVEYTCLGLAADLDYTSALDEFTKPLMTYFAGMSTPALILEDLESRMEDGFIPIEDLSRNRIYPVGAAQGFLLDYFGIAWKARAQEAGPGFTFVRLLSDGLEMDEQEFPGLVKKAKDLFEFERIVVSSRHAVEEYLQGYADQLERFESQPGVRVELTLNTNGVHRSRVSHAKKWIVERGSRCLRSHYEVYTLRGDGWSLDLHDAGLLEIEDWDAKRRTVVFYVPAVTSLSVDGQPMPTHADASLDFQSIELHGENFRISSSKPGALIFSENSCKMRLLSN